MRYRRRIGRVIHERVDEALLDEQLVRSFDHHRMMLGACHHGYQRGVREHPDVDGVIHDLKTFDALSRFFFLRGFRLRVEWP